MSSAAPLQTVAAKPLQTAGANLTLQRKCACGAGASSLTGECAECGKKKLGLQTKLRINEPGDAYEQEADRVAEQVLSKPAHPDVSSTPPRIQRFSGQSSGQMGAAPASVDRVLASPASPLDPALRQEMEQRFGHDFSRVRVHSDVASGISARHVNAHAYTSGHDIVFGAGRFAPETVEGRRLLAHELTHVVQQTAGSGRSNGASNAAAPIQRDESGSNPIPDPKDLAKMYLGDMYYWTSPGDDEFDGIAARLVSIVSVHSSPNKYILEVLKAVGPRFEDNVGAAFVNRLSNSKLDQFAASEAGRHMLNHLYKAIITGDVSAFEREQANRILKAKVRRKSPENYIRGTMKRSGGQVTPIFPVRFMRVTPGYDYAPPEVKLMPNGRIHVRYPLETKSGSMFKDELRTLGDVFGAGMELNPNEIVGIRDYEQGGGVVYLPALALIDYANQAIESTSGKIIEVAIVTATFGFGGGAAGARAAATEASALARWGTRLARGAKALDRVANFIGIAAFFINENRAWIISKFGETGRRLVQLSEIANSAAAIYGLGRLGQGGYQIVKEMRAASKQARALNKQLTEAQAKVLNRLDEETDLMLKELDEEAAKTAAPAAGAEKPGATGRVDDPAAAKPPARAAGKPTGTADELDAAASKIGIATKQLDGEIQDLRRQTANPKNVRQSQDPKLDAGMNGRGHEFNRNKKDRTWCRRSEEKCDLNLGAQLNTNVDSALAKKRAQQQATAKTPTDPPKAPPGPGPTAAAQKAEPPESVWVQLEDGRVREYKPSEVTGDVGRGANVGTPEGRGQVVGHGDPPMSRDVKQPNVQPGGFPSATPTLITPKQLNDFIPQAKTARGPKRRLTPNERDMANEIQDALMDVNRGNKDAMNRLASFRSHKHSGGEFGGWWSVDLLSGNPGALNQMRVYVRKGKNGLLQAIIRQYH